MSITESKRKRLEEESAAIDQEIEELETAKKKLIDSKLKEEFQSHRSELQDLIYAMRREDLVMSKMAGDIMKVKHWESVFPPSDQILIKWMANGYGVRAIQWFYGDEGK